MKRTWGFVRNARSLIGGIALLAVLAGVVSTAPAQQPTLRYTFDPTAAIPDSLTLMHDRSNSLFAGAGLNGNPTDCSFNPGPSGLLNAMCCPGNNTAPPGGDWFAVDIGGDTVKVGIDSGPFTAMAWVFRFNLAGDNMVFGTDFPPGGAAPALHLGFRDDQVYMGFWGNDSNTGSEPAFLGQWHHVAWRHIPNFPFSDGGVQDIFIDGFLVSRTGGHPAYGAPGQGAQILYVGRTVPNNGDFAGCLCDARIYNVALSDDDIADIAHDPP